MSASDIWEFFRVSRLGFALSCFSSLIEAIFELLFRSSLFKILTDFSLLIS